MPRTHTLPASARHGLALRLMDEALADATDDAVLTSAQLGRDYWPAHTTESGGLHLIAVNGFSVVTTEVAPCGAYGHSTRPCGVCQSIGSLVQ